MALSTAAGASGVERWAVSRAVHYNEWANFGKKDFEPVVKAFKELLECFSCETCKSLGACYAAWNSRVSPLRMQCD